MYVLFRDNVGSSVLPSAQGMLTALIKHFVVGTIIIIKHFCHTAHYVI